MLAEKKLAYKDRQNKLNILQDSDCILFIFVASLSSIEFTYFRITIPTSEMHDGKKETMFFPPDDFTSDVFSLSPLD